MNKPKMWLIDTSVLCNILNLPGFNQDRTEIISEFENKIVSGDSFFLPYSVFVETGNHIAQLSGNYKHDFAEKFVVLIKKALNDEVPFKPLKFPEKEQLLNVIDEFTTYASKGIGFADFTIIEDWKEQKNKFVSYSVRIWSLDSGLQGYES